MLRPRRPSARGRSTTPPTAGVARSPPWCSTPEDAGDPPVPESSVAVKGVVEDRCPAAGSLAGLALDRLPAA
ncbi:hypothetical protein AB0425_08940 [Actinosynnema sp. NPDC051121]